MMTPIAENKRLQENLLDTLNEEMYVDGEVIDVEEVKELPEPPRALGEGSH